VRAIAPRALPSAAIVELARTPWNTELILDRPGRYTVRDDGGRRIVDLRHGGGRLRLVLPPYSRRFMLVEKIGRGERSYEISAGRRALLGDLIPVESSVGSRGMVDDAVFERLFSTPFDARQVTSRPVIDARCDAATWGVTDSPARRDRPDRACAC
jgi:hypothetical protein